MSEKTYKITDFSAGWFNSGDFSITNLPENGGSVATNVRSIPGALLTRYSNGDLLTSNLTAAVTFREMQLLGASNASVRFLLVQDGTSVKQFLYSAGYSAINKTFTGGSLDSGDICYFNTIKNSIRVSSWSGWDDTSTNATWIGYISRNQMNDNVTNADYFQEDNWITVPKFSLYSFAGASSGSTDVLHGTYFIRYTYEYDGFQEGWYRATYGGATTTAYGSISIAASSSYEHLDLTVREDTALTYATNPRATAINIYVARSSQESASLPETGYYHVARVDINDSNWTYDATTAGGTESYDLVVTLETDNTNQFPASYYTSGFDDPITKANISEEMHTRNGSIAGSFADTAGRLLTNYTKSVWSNGRNFVIRPTVETAAEILPWDMRQVVLFSNLNKPDVFDWDIDYIDVSTPEGDVVTGIMELFGDIIIFKEYSVFRVSFNNSGRSLDWSVTEHFQDVGCIAPNSIAKGNGVIYYAGIDNIYRFDGAKSIPITNNKVRQIYSSNLGDQDKESEVWGAYDRELGRYLLNFTADSAQSNIYIYEESNQSFWKWEDAFTPVPVFLTSGIDNKLLGAAGTEISTIADTSSGAETFEFTWTSGWISLGNHFKEKRIKWIKVLYKSTKDFSIEITNDTSDAVTLTATDSTNILSDVYKEASLLGKRFMITANGLLFGNSETASINEIEFGYEELIKER